MNKRGTYYIYEETRTGRIHVAKNKEVLQFEIIFSEKRQVSISELRDRFSVIGEIHTEPFCVMFYGLENFKKQVKAATINAICRILG